MRATVLGAVVVLTVVVAGCGSATTATGGGSSPSSPTGSTPAVAEPAACAVLGPMWGAKAATPANDTTAFERLLDVAPAELQDDVAFIADMGQKIDAGTADKADAPKLEVALKKTLDWAATNCPSGGPYWNCTARRKFAAVSSAIDDKDTRAPSGGPGAPTPAEARKLTQGTGPPVELSASDTEVVYGYTDPGGRITKSEIVRKSSSGWTSVETRSCP